ncbi:hypothetical protein H9L11_08070 [Vibrio sp. sp1]|uniref:hypothetical protein n=1 Tax=Vibrio sp. sp1 TaxID=2766781 RepID=UPI0019637FA2|nr:hypothetical protein [Vibrio sp. sp1]QRZ21195.1 hypothetical protein H9L11_08070 [Vibrio sp. sp1]
MLTPIMLRSFGRSGSTLLMQVLGTNDNVIFDRDYPCETRHLTYLYRLASLPSQAFNNDKNWNQDSLFDKNLDRLGSIPFSNTDIIRRDNLKEGYLKHLWAAFSREALLNSNDSVDPSKPCYYAEKVVQDICNDVNSNMAAKNLFLIRDPRDEFLSIKSFNKKRNFNGFGWNENDTDESFALKLCQMRKQFLIHLNAVQKDDRRIVVKYEDFLSSPIEGTSELSEWLNLELDYSKISNPSEQFKDHITSNNVNDSLFRWKKELPKEILNIFKDNIGKELELLNYEI